MAALAAFFVLPGLLALLLVGCEVIPKTLIACGAPEGPWALRVAGPMKFLQRATRPVRYVAQRLNSAILGGLLLRSAKPLTGMGDEEYQELLELAFQQGTLAQSEKEIILQIIRLDRQTAKDVMKARAQMASISDELSVEEMIADRRGGSGTPACRFMTTRPTRSSAF